MAEYGRVILVYGKRRRDGEERRKEKEKREGRRRREDEEKDEGHD